MSDSDRSAAVPLIRPAAPTDAGTIKALAVAAGMFTVDEVDFFDEILAGSFDGSLEGHHWLIAQDSAGSTAAAAYYAPEPFADRVWNLYFLAVDPATQGSGMGAALIDDIESQLRSLGETEARVLIVETSSTDQYADTRSFYARRGFDEEARIRDFYGPGDTKVVFWKSLLAD